MFEPSPSSRLVACCPRLSRRPRLSQTAMGVLTAVLAASSAAGRLEQRLQAIAVQIETETTAALANETETLLSPSRAGLQHDADPARREPPDAEPGGPRRVFAHYMVCFYNSIEFYKQEIELAQRHGIEGFALNCGEWFKMDPQTGERGEGNYPSAAERMYQAALELGTGFQLFISVDLATLGSRHAGEMSREEFRLYNMADMVDRFYDHPNQFRVGDRRVLSTWGGRAWSLEPILEAIRDGGREILFVPMVWSPNNKMAWSYETVLNFFHGYHQTDGVFYFGVDDSVNGILNSNATGRRVTQHLGKVFMAGVGPTYNSANLRDFRGFHGYGAIWEGIIRDGADWVELFTWNDYTETSNFMPWRWQGNFAKHFFCRDESFLDVSGYYTRWYRARRPPAIVQDKVYYAYRTRPHQLRTQWHPETEQWVDVTRNPPRKRDQIHDDVQDKLYATTFLTEPAELTIELGGHKHVFEQPAGIAHVDVPLAAGVPRFTLRRDRRDLTAFSGRKLIIDASTQTKENSTWMGDHYANQLWTGGTTVGEVVRRFEAADGDLTGDAEIVTVNGRRGVRNRETDNSGFRIPVAGLDTATYAVRVTYSNPSANEARLTLYSDGPPRGATGWGEYPYYIPLFLPPTGESETDTTSFLWSLYENTTHLMPVWRENRGDLSSDRGTPVLHAIELIRVEPTVEPKRRSTLFPELVEIPGGTFTMGSDTDDPDEAPTHRVTLSPFAIGRYPVTNEEYERFDPEHRRHRDGFSWRDREPVIYVRWTEAARYCNWLSEQTGLSPAYTFEGNTATFHPEAEGFRLPSEAEWEYVASGRGESRRHPWGDDQPVAGYHGHFAAHDPLMPDVGRAGNLGSTRVVGDFPAGASRDGVMDLAGNVVEWVNDVYHPYTAEAKTDPHAVDPPVVYRSIRGSSWDYYGMPLHVSDREFNNPNYGGYITIGFRVALPEAGILKLEEME